MCWGEYKAVKLTAVAVVPAIVAVAISGVSPFEGAIIGFSAVVVSQMMVA